MNAVVLNPPFAPRKAVIARAVAEIARTHGFGQFITRAELEALFDLHEPAKPTVRNVRSFTAKFAGLKADFDRALLRDHQMAQCSCGAGRWEIVKPQDQAKYADKVAREGVADTFAKARAIASNVRVDVLTVEQQREVSDNLARLASIEMLAKGGWRKRALAQTAPAPKSLAG